MDQVSLVVDYSNGVQKTFMGIAWKQGMTIAEIVKSAGSTPPGLAIDSFSDRTGHEIINAIDGVKADRSNRQWLLWIGERFIGDRLETDTSARLSSGKAVGVNAGDTLLLKLSTSVSPG